MLLLRSVYEAADALDFMPMVCHRLGLAHHMSSSTHGQGAPALPHCMSALDSPCTRLLLRQDEYQMRFFKVRQGEWQTYLEACKPIAVRQVPRLDPALHTSFCAEQHVSHMR